MKKFLKVLCIIAVFFIGITMVNAEAPSTPEFIDKSVYGTFDNLFFANGTPITIESNGGAGADINWAGGSMTVPVNTIVFGGGLEKSYTSTSITMNGGQIDTIFGGSIKGGHVGETNVTINGGEIDWVHGAGASNLVTGLVGPETTGVANITLNGGKKVTGGQGYNLVFGGGNGYTSVDEAYIIINGGTWDYVTGGGSNGHTGLAEIAVLGGTVDVIQTVNRGTMDSAAVAVGGGTVGTLYAGGETGDSGVTGTIDKVEVAILGGTVTNLRIGKSGGTEMTASDDVTLLYKAGTITNSIDLSKFETYEQIVLVTIDGELYFASVGETLSALDPADLLAIKTKAGHTFVKFINKADGLDFGEDTPITDDIELETVFQMNSATDNNDQKNPDTSDNIITIAAIALVSVVGLVGSAILIKKTKKVNA